VALIDLIEYHPQCNPLLRCDRPILDTTTSGYALHNLEIPSLLGKWFGVRRSRAVHVRDSAGRSRFMCVDECQ
jgi:hypothetical protein